MADSQSSAPDPLEFIARPSPTLRAAVTQQQGILSEADFAGFIGAVRSAFQKYTKKLLEFSPGADRAEALHILLDREIARVGPLVVSCTKGCCGCCHYEIETTNDEAALLAAAVRAGCAVDRDRLNQQAGREPRSPKWLEFWSADNRCVFLDADGACRVYDDRPASCRKHLVTSPPEACTTVGGAVVPLQLLLVEVLVSAAVSIPETSFASLPKMLLAELGAEVR